MANEQKTFEKVEQTTRNAGNAAMNKACDKASDAACGLSDSAQKLASSIGESARETYDEVSTKLSDGYKKGKEVAANLKTDDITSFFKEYPVATFIGGVTMGLFVAKLMGRDSRS